MSIHRYFQSSLYPKIIHSTTNFVSTRNKNSLPRGGTSDRTNTESRNEAEQGESVKIASAVARTPLEKVVREPTTKIDGETGGGPWRDTRTVAKRG